MTDPLTPRSESPIPEYAYNPAFTPQQVVDEDYAEFEQQCIKIERCFNQLGRMWGVSLVTGALRIGMGLSLFLFPLLYSAVKLVQAVFNRIVFGAESAAIHLAYCTRGLNYTAHALANAFRGACEMFQLGAFFKMDPTIQLYKYPTSISLFDMNEGVEMTNFNPEHLAQLSNYEDV